MTTAYTKEEAAAAARQAAEAYQAAANALSSGLHNRAAAYLATAATLAGDADRYVQAQQKNARERREREGIAERGGPREANGPRALAIAGRDTAPSSGKAAAR